MTNKSSSLNSKNKKGTNKEVINKQVLDLLNFDNNQKEQLDIYELNNL